MTILIVEDDPNSMGIMCDALEMDDYDIVTAGNGQEGIEMLRKRNDIELILLDRMMPVMDGMAFIERAKEEQLVHDIPVVMQTAASSQEQVIDGTATGIYYYLVKPYDYKHLLAVVRGALDEAKRLQANVS